VTSTAIASAGWAHDPHGKRPLQGQLHQRRPDGPGEPRVSSKPRPTSTPTWISCGAYWSQPSPTTSAWRFAEAAMFYSDNHFAVCSA
jgi:hypothetical protein